MVARFYRRIGVAVSVDSALSAYRRGTVDRDCKEAIAAEPRYEGPGTGLPLNFYHAARLLNVRGPTTTGADILQWYRATRPALVDPFEIASAYIASGCWKGAKKGNS